jgi:hypothetical protein
MKSENNLLGNTFIHTLLIQIHTLEFTILYNSLSKGRGGGDWKTKFNQQAFQASDEFGHLFVNLPTAEKKRRLAEMDEDYAAWVKRSQEKVTRRNRLLSMYRTVGFFYSVGSRRVGLPEWQFGPALLLDKTWAVDKLRHRSRTFYRMYEVLKAGMMRHWTQEEEEGVAKLRNGFDGLSVEEKDGNAAGLCIFLAKKLAGDDGLADYVTAFFDKYPAKDLRGED